MIEVKATLRRENFELSIDARFEGPVNVIIGSSGSGKTTLLDAIAGVIRPVRGRISLGEHVVSDENVWVPPERRGVGYTFQEDRLFPHLDIERNLAFGARHPSADQKRAAVRTVAERLDIASLLKRRPRALSGGQRRRVAIGRALLAATSVVILDEPLAGLDDGLRRDVAKAAIDIAGRAGLPMILVTHHLDAIEGPHKVFTLSDGALRTPQSDSV
jgi:molybdate transport system ATP-binding protein